MIRLFLIFTLSINIYADNNKTVIDRFKVLENKIYKLEQKNILLHKKDIKLVDKINNIKSNDKIYLIKSFAKELNSDSWITILISLFALIISAISIWLNFKNNKVNVEVIPVSLNVTGAVTHNSSNYYNKDINSPYFGIDIVNKSNFDININSITFLSSIDKINQYTLNSGIFSVNKEKVILPLKLEQRNTTTIYFKIDDLKDIKSLYRVKVSLATGENILGTNKAFKELINSLNA